MQYFIQTQSFNQINMLDVSGQIMSMDRQTH